MARPKSLKPAYCLHKSSGRAFVKIDGRPVYLGRHGTQASHDRYDAAVGEWIAKGRPAVAAKPEDPAKGITVSQLLAAFFDHAQSYYRDADGKPTDEIHCFRSCMRPVRRMYGNTAAGEFGPLKLKAVRQSMIESKWGRKSINKQVGRVKAIFKWGVAEELVPASVHQGLAAVAGLARGKSDARETEDVRPVPEAAVLETLPHCSPVVRAMVKLQLVTGMRPGEVCRMRGVDLDTTGALWTYKPERHKTAHHGHDRTVYLGPKAQEIVGPFLTPDLHAYLFSPAASAEWHRDQRRTKPAKAGGTAKAKRAARAPGECFTVDAYRVAITRACQKAYAMPADLKEPTPTAAKQTPAIVAPEAIAVRKAGRKVWRFDHVWHPHQLRHSAATNLRKDFGIEAAQVILGHKCVRITEVYAEKNTEAARKIMAAVG